MSASPNPTANPVVAAEPAQAPLEAVRSEEAVTEVNGVERVNVVGKKGETVQNFIVRANDVDKTAEPASHKAQMRLQRRRRAMLKGSLETFAYMFVSFALAGLMFLLNKISMQDANYPGDIGFLEIPLYVWVALPVCSHAQFTHLKIIIATLSRLSDLFLYG